MDSNLRKQKYLLRSQQYILKESISDSSSDDRDSDEEEKHLPMHKRRRTNTSSSLRSSSPAPLNDAVVDMMVSQPIELDSISSIPEQAPLPQNSLQEEDIIDITGDANDDDEDEAEFLYYTNLSREGSSSLSRQNRADRNDLDATKRTPFSSSSSTNPEQTSSATHSTEIIVPLRSRADSDLQFYREKLAENHPIRSSLVHSTSHRRESGTQSQSNSNIEKETPERWRNRLWPGKAIIAYCRIITRCRPPDCKTGEKVSWTKDAIKAHWRENEMHKVGVNFDNVMMHSSAFFLLTVEESRAAVSNSEDSEQPILAPPAPPPPAIPATATATTTTITSTTTGDTTASIPSERTSTTSKERVPASVAASSYYQTIGNNGWLDCEIIGIVGESEFGSLPQACDPKLGSVWIISVAIKTPNIHLQEAATSPLAASKNTSLFGGAGGISNTVPKSKSSTHMVKESSLSGGDLVVMNSQQWNHSMLGIIQPWDPDYDLKFGINFHSHISQHSKYMESFYNDNCADLTTANILICVDSGDNNNINNATNNANNNPTTSNNTTNNSNSSNNSSDIGGWASQGTIHAGVTFSMAIIGNVMTYIRECQALMSLKLLNARLRDAVLKPYQTLSLPTAAAPLPQESSSAVLAAPSSLGSEITTTSKFQGPKNIPPKLWNRLAEEYNESQLKAIRSVCQPSSAVCLLQGPPGSGKTKTILGVLSVMLAGALRPPQKTIKVIAGSSFRSETKAGSEFSEIVGRRGRSDSLVSEHGGSGGGGGAGGGGGNSGLASLRSLAVNPGDRPRVLVCAPSNTAVDELVFRILSQGIYDSEGYKTEDLNVVRIGSPLQHRHSPAATTTTTTSSTSAAATTSSSSSSFLTPLTEEDYNVMKIVERVSLENIVEDRRRALQASDAKKQLGISFKYADIRKQILEKADIVCCTLSGAGSQPILEVILRITGYKFDAVIIDEAAQAVEPSSLIPFKYNPQLVVLVGDPCQLPATVFSRIAKEANYSQSLFLRLQKLGNPVTMLQTQYRMHPVIAQYPSLRFYANRLFTDPSVNAKTTHYQPYHDDASGRFGPFLFHDLQYSREEMDGTSICNREEARYIIALYDELIRRYPQARKNIGIIAPYRAQRRYLLQLFYSRYGHHAHSSGKGASSTRQRDQRLVTTSSLDTEIATVDGFQGREKDIIIFSCVRSSSSSSSSHYSSSFDSIGFLREWQRLNVAITRAKYALWIVGNSKTLQKDSEWGELIAYSRRMHYLLTFPNERSTVFPRPVNPAVGNGHGNHPNNSNSNSNSAGERSKHKEKHRKKHKHHKRERERSRSRERERERERDHHRRDRDHHDHDRR